MPLALVVGPWDAVAVSASWGLLGCCRGTSASWLGACSAEALALGWLPSV